MMKLINFLKWFFAIAVFGIAAYAIYQGWLYLKGKASAVTDAFKPSQYKKGAEQTTFEKYFPNIAEIKDKAIDYFTRNPINPVVPIVTDIIDKVKEPIRVSPTTEFVKDTKSQGAVSPKVATDLKLVPLGISYYVPEVKKGALGISEKNNTQTLSDLSGLASVGKDAMVKVSPEILKAKPPVLTTFKQVSKARRE